MEYHAFSGMSAVNLAKFWRKILPSSLTLSFLTDNLSRTQLKTAPKSICCVDRGFLFNTQSSYLLCFGSTETAVKPYDSVSVAFLTGEAKPRKSLVVGQSDVSKIC